MCVSSSSVLTDTHTHLLTHMHTMRSDLFDWPRTFVCKPQNRTLKEDGKAEEKEKNSTARKKWIKGKKTEKREKEKESRSVSSVHCDATEDVWTQIWCAPRGCALRGMLLFGCLCPCRPARTMTLISVPAVTLPHRVVLTALLSLALPF